MSAYTIKHLLGKMNPLRTTSMLQLLIIHMLLSCFVLLQQDRSKQIRILDNFRYLTSKERVSRVFFGGVYIYPRTKRRPTGKKRKMLICCCSGQSHEASVLFLLPRLTADCKANVTQCILQFNSLPAFKFHLKAMNSMVITEA